MDNQYQGDYIFESDNDTSNICYSVAKKYLEEQINNHDTSDITMVVIFDGDTIAQRVGCQYCNDALANDWNDKILHLT